MTEKVRVYTKEVQDTLNTRSKVAAAMIKGALLSDFETQTTISEADITKFCQGCDNFMSEGVPCRAVGSNDQARYAARGLCGWAFVKGERVTKKNN